MQREVDAGSTRHRDEVDGRLVHSQSSLIKNGFRRAIAMGWNVAFVDPPVTITSRTAFSKACFVMISRGLRPTAMQCCSASTALRTSDTCRAISGDLG